MSGHALLSPSSAERWLNCTPSARLEESFPDRAGASAAEGTLAHKLGELLIAEKLGLPANTEPAVRKKQFKKALTEIQADPLYSPEMLEHCENYAVFVMERYSEAQQRTRDAMVFLEVKLDLTAFVPEGFGTSDTTIIADHVMEIVDLKYGKGIAVSAQDNKQMKLYALGALDRFDYLYDISRVRMTIYQPRIDNYSSFEISVEELQAWAVEELTPRAKLAFAGEGEYQPGKHCQFCKAKAVCRAIAEYNLQLARHEFKKPDLLNDGEVVEILDRSAMFESWLKAVKEHTLHEAIHNNKKWPGYKVVEGRSNRKYGDEKNILLSLVKAGYPSEDITRPATLKPITELEKEIGKEPFKTFVGPFVIKPPGKPTLVPESDKRPAMDSSAAAAAEFSEAE